MFSTRPALHCAALRCAAGLIPVSDVNALSFLAPVFVALLAPRLLGEPTSPAVLAALPFCAAGVLLVAQPSLLFGRGLGGRANALGVALGVAHVSVGACAGRRWQLN